MKAQRMSTKRRRGYVMLAVRVREGVMEALDREVERLQLAAVSRELGEPKVTRTTVVLAALNAYLQLIPRLPGVPE